jgi:hypothetical protein
MSALGVLSGYWERLAAMLCAGLLVEIIVALAWMGGDNNLIIRDVGLLGLALSLVVEPTKSRSLLLHLVPRDHFSANRMAATAKGQAPEGEITRRPRLEEPDADSWDRTLEPLNQTLRAWALLALVGLTVMLAGTAVRWVVSARKLLERSM